MAVNYIPRRFTVIRDKELCVNCGLCVEQCANECHYFAKDNKTVLANSDSCVACHRCVDLCPKGALRIAGNMPPGKHRLDPSFRYG